MSARTAAAHRPLLRRTASAAILAVAIAAWPGTTLALSELQPVPGQDAGNTAPADPDLPAVDVPVASPTEPAGLPAPDPLINPAPAGQANPSADSDADNKAETLHDISLAPEPVRRMRALIVEAAASGDITRLKTLMNPGPDQTQLSLGGGDDDPVEVLKSFSGDPDGLEILAIILDVLSSGFAHVGAGTPEEMYVWPYFAEAALADLSPPEKVELLRIVTAGDYADMLDVGNYNFFRLGISPDGQWKFFLAGD